MVGSCDTYSSKQQIIKWRKKEVKYNKNGKGYEIYSSLKVY